MSCRGLLGSGDRGALIRRCPGTAMSWHRFKRSSAITLWTSCAASAALEEIQKAGQRAASLTQQLLAFSRKQVLQPQEVDLNQTVQRLRSLLTRLIREDITLMCELADEPALVRIDPTQIEQAILNSC